MSSSLESIDYIENCKYNIVKLYKEKKYDILNPNNLNSVVKKLSEMVFYIDKKYRKKVILRVLSQIISDQYIESKIDWREYDTLIDMIYKLEIEDKDENCCQYCQLF